MTEHRQGNIDMMDRRMEHRHHGTQAGEHRHDGT